VPVFKRELAFSPVRPLEMTGDWWHLILDTDAPGIYIEHTWRYAAPYSDGQMLNGMERFGINDFLSLTQGQPAQSALLGALREIFRETKPN